MKLSLKSLIAVVALGVAALPMISSAQDAGKKGGGGRGGQPPEARVAAIEEAVGTLTADVKTKIMAILTKQAADMQGVAQEDRQTKGAEIRTAANKAIRALLTPEQATKFDAMPQGGRGGGGGKKKGN